MCHDIQHKTNKYIFEPMIKYLAVPVKIDLGSQNVAFAVSFSFRNKSIATGDIAGNKI